MARSEKAKTSDAYSGGMSGKAKRKAEAAAEAEAAKRSADDMVSVGVEGTEEGKESDDVIQPQDQSLTSLVSETSLDLSAEVTLPETTTTVLENISEEGKEE
jgi:hypothetical protein